MIIRVQNRLSPLVNIDIASWLHAEHKKKILKQRLIVFITKLTLSTGIDISLSNYHAHGIG